MNLIKDFLRSRRLGFYFTAAAILLAAVQFIVYLAAFTAPEWTTYMHWTVPFFSALAIVSGAALSLFKKTAPFAPAAVTLCAFLSFLMFAKFGYMYFSIQFYGGITAARIANMYYGYLADIILYVLIFVTGIAAIFMKQTKAGDVSAAKEA